MVNGPCANCGGEVKPKKYAPRRRYCSPKCYHEANKASVEAQRKRDRLENGAELRRYERLRYAAKRKAAS